MLNEEQLRQKVWAFEQLFNQKSGIVPPEICMSWHKAEIAALLRQFAVERRKHFEIKDQLSEAISLLETAQDERDKLQLELNRRDAVEKQLNEHHFWNLNDPIADSRTAYNPKLKVFLEQLFTFSCDPQLEKKLEEEEEKRLWEDHADDDDDLV